MFFFEFYFSKRIMSLYPLNLMAVGLLKLVQLHMRLITFPILASKFILQTITRKLLRAWSSSYLYLNSFICSTLTSYKQDSLKLATRFTKAVFSSLYVLTVLVFLLFSGFAMSGYVIRNLTQPPLHMTQTLNFDYTKATPVAVVSIPASQSAYKHRIQLTVSLTLPESDRNVNIGIFQIRVESLSAKGDVIASSSYPALLRFKSHVVRVIESSVKVLHLITGLKSEVQNLIVVAEGFGEGDEATAGFKVSLEKRNGGGVPDVCGASLGIESELPPLQAMVWKWRLTLFVWIGFVSFLAEIVVLLLFSWHVILPGRRSKL